MAAMAARAIWKGNISFGLVEILIQVSVPLKKRVTNRLTNYAKIDLES
jgi:non-homologous end joining protein Ku